MEEQRHAGGPITYVGGLGDQPRPHAWPYIAFGLVPLIIAAGVLVFWSPLQALGRGAGKTIAPYSLALTEAGWSSNDMIATVPVTLVLGVDNTDQRTIDGITIRFTQLDRSWEILGASAPNAHPVVQGKSIYFPNQLAPKRSVRMSIVMRPATATEANVGVSFAAGHDATPARVDIGSGTLTNILLIARVRKATEDDASAVFTAIYDPLPIKNQESSWQINVTNTGPITIDQIQLVFPADFVDAFQPYFLPGQATQVPGTPLPTLQFDVNLPPGGQTVLITGVVPQTAGKYQIPIHVKLEKSGVPMLGPNGGAPLTVDVTVR